MDNWFTHNLVCPRDHGHLRLVGDRLACANNHEYPIVEGVPIMLLDNVQQTHWVANASLQAAHRALGSEVRDPFFIDTLGCSEDERQGIRRQFATMPEAHVDPVVNYMIGATNGLLHKPLIGRLPSYPIPQLRLPLATGQLFLDLGCNWGRWCIAAARKRYTVVGIEPSLGAIMAAKRVSKRLGIAAKYVVADARYLPFPAKVFDVVFSYSVLQHFSKQDALLALLGAARVLRDDGMSLIQMPNAFGIRSLQHQMMRGFRSTTGFDVRYWTPLELKRTFGRLIGETALSVDCFFGLGLQYSDMRLLPFKYQVVLRTSELLRRISRRLPLLSLIADSVYVRSRRKLELRST